MSEVTESTEEKQRGRGRPLIGEAPLSSIERNRRYREKSMKEGVLEISIRIQNPEAVKLFLELQNEFGESRAALGRRLIEESLVGRTT